MRNRYNRLKKLRSFFLSGLLFVGLALLSIGIRAQEATSSLKGLIENEQGEPMQSVSVLLKNGSGDLQLNALSDEQGIFSFTGLQPGHAYEITVSYIGYETQVIRKTKLNPGKQESILIRLRISSGSMEGIVVVGYGTQKRKDITGAVASVPRSRLDKVPNLNIAQVLQGSVAGLIVRQTQAGAASNESILIRGRKSILASNSPLIVLDGIPYGGQLSDINVNNVASIEVLKDASAAAIYGSRGSNGVILITTKTGFRSKPVVSYDGKYSLQRAINVPYFMNGDEFYQFKNIREPGKLTSSEQEIYDGGKAANWSDLVLRNGGSQLHNLSVAGGFQGVKYYVGGSYLDVKGITVGDDYRRYTSQINMDIKINNWLTLGTRTQLAYDDKSGSTVNWEDVLKANPLTTAYNPDGTIKIYPWQEYTDIGNALEPLNYQNTDKSQQVVTNNFLMVDFPFLKGLSYRLNTGIRKTTYDAATYIGRDTKRGLEARGIANTTRTIANNTVIENILSYNKELGKHTFSTTALYSYEENINSSNIVDASGFPHDFLTYYSTAQAKLINASYDYYRTVLISQMARLNYAYDSRYLLTLTGRRDGYSGFGSNSKWGFFPSVAVGWNVSSEKFFPWKKFFDKFKLRASVGRNGNQAVSAYESISRLREENMVSLDQSLPGYIPSKLGQDNLGWESTATINLGLDFSILKNRVTGDINIYKTNTSDLLLNRTISLVHGITSITQNIGETENRGIELSLSTQNIEGKKFSWSTSGTLSFIKNKIVSLYGMLDKDGVEINDVANSWFIGNPILINYDYVWDGVWQQDEASAASAWGSVPGFVKLRDVDGDKKLTSNDRQITGQRDPKFLWGMSNSFSYKNFNLEIFIYGIHGVTSENPLLQDASASSEVRRNVLKKNWWTPQNPASDFYSNVINAEKMSGISAKIYENASFMRVKDISLSYDLPSSILQKSGFGKLRCYITGRNLFTITKWTASDPELNFGRGAIPLQKEMVIGVSVML